MSGPKVVRIVTREELIDICEGHLARVDAALAEWTKVCARNDCLDEAALANAKSRRDRLASMIAADRFMDLQKEAPIEEGFLMRDIQDRLAGVAARQAEERSRERREGQAAASLLTSLDRAGISLDADLASGIKRCDPVALARGFERLADAGRAVRDDGLAIRLRGEEPRSSFADWLAAQPEVPADPAIERIQVRIDELAQHGATALVAGWSSRLAEAGRENGARRGLLLDGLEVETGRMLTEVRRRAALAMDLRLVVAELASAGAAITEFDGAPDAATAELQAMSEAARTALTLHRSAKAAEARRAAVLEGLVGLGYEVTEGMSTSWVEDGRLVLRSAARPDYGVEITSPAGAVQMQMRPVAFEATGRGPNPSRDRDAETIWCGDVSRLDKHLEGLGGDFVIERSLPIGATPLRRISVAGSDVAAAAAAEVPTRLKGRTLD